MCLQIHVSIVQVSGHTFVFVLFLFWPLETQYILYCVAAAAHRPLRLLMTCPFLRVIGDSSSFKYQNYGML